MAHSTGMLWAGLSALFVGGMLGGALASLLLRPDAPIPVAALEPTAESHDEDAIVRALGVLTEEVRRLQIRRDGSVPLERAPVGTEVPATNGSGGELLTAIERLTTALSQAPSRVAAAGGKPPLVVPVGSGYRQSLVRAMDGRECEDLSSELRFLNYQQVLERFGAPDEARKDEAFVYRLTDPNGEQREVYFQFVDGYLFNIYY